MVDRILELEERTKIQILAPVVSHRKGSHEKLIADIGKKAMYVLELTAILSMSMRVPELDKIKPYYRGSRRPFGS